MDITLMDTIIRTGIPITGRTMATLTTGLTMGMAGTVTTATIVTTTTTIGTNPIYRSQNVELARNSSQLLFCGKSQFLAVPLSILPR